MSTTLQASASRWGKPLVPVFCGFWLVALYVASFPNVDFSEGSLVFALPFLLWAWTAPRWRVFLPVALVASWVAWALILVWLRNLPVGGWAACLSLGLAMGLFLTGWLAAARWALPRTRAMAWPARAGVLLGLAGLWVVLEWVRTWLLSGFPWLPLAAAWWQNPQMLAFLPWTGAWGLSFLLVFFNLALASKLRQFHTGYFLRRREGRARRDLCPEFYLGLILLVAPLMVFLLTLGEEADPRQKGPAAFRVAFVQPDIPAELKWQPGAAQAAWESVRDKTRNAAAAAPDLILWPETAMPGSLIHHASDGLAELVGRLVDEAGAPLRAGSLAVPAEGVLHNAVIKVSPNAGVAGAYQAKRKLVPFGEFVPLRGILPLGKVVPIEQDTDPGGEAVPMTVELAGKPWSFGALVCYEDIFPHLSREMVRAGADVLYVATNNAWYGKEAGAYQHAAHSVLRAAELRRPVLRCGNSGWSGWIDARGRIRHVFLPDNNTTIYAGGWSVVPFRSEVGRDAPLTVYARWGDWFVSLCGALVVLGAVPARRAKSRAQA